MLTMLWVPNDPDVPREIGLSTSMVPFLRDTYFSDEACMAETRRKINPCPFAPTWLDGLCGSPGVLSVAAGTAPGHHAEQ